VRAETRDGVVGVFDRGVEQVGLVVDPQAPPGIGDRVGDGDTAHVGFACIEDDDRQVRASQLFACTTHAFAFDRIAPSRRPAVVDEREFAPSRRTGFVPQVARGARDVGDDRAGRCRPAR
jgi:hypothetical protein